MIYYPKTDKFIFIIKAFCENNVKRNRKLEFSAVIGKTTFVLTTAKNQVKIRININL